MTCDVASRTTLRGPWRRRGRCQCWPRRSGGRRRVVATTMARSGSPARECTTVYPSMRAGPSCSGASSRTAVRAQRLVGHVGEPEAAVRRTRRPHCHPVLRDHPADAGDEPRGSRLLAQHFHHLGERLEVVVVERAARERHAARHGERSFGPETQLLGLHLHRRREAAVQIEVVGVARVDAGHRGQLVAARR